MYLSDLGGVVEREAVGEGGPTRLRKHLPARRSESGWNVTLFFNMI